MSKQLKFEELGDFDIDGGAVRVGLQHYPIGEPGPCLIINTGAVEVIVRAHESDFDTLIDGLKSARKKLRNRVKP